MASNGSGEPPRTATPVEDHGEEANTLPMEKDHFLILTSQAEEDKRTARDIHQQLRNKGFTGREEATHYARGDNNYRETFLDVALESKKIIAILTPSYLNTYNTGGKFKDDLDLIEKITQRKGLKVFIPILKEVDYTMLPPRLRQGVASRHEGECPSFGGPDFYKCLIKHITEDVLLVPTRCPQGVSQANGHFLNYLRYILPDLKERTNDAFAKQRDGRVGKWDCFPQAILCSKFIEIIPVTGEFLTNIHEYDSAVTALHYIPDTGKPVKIVKDKDHLGHEQKPYPSCMYKVTVDGKEYIFPGELPSTLQTLKIMKDFNMYGYADDQDAVNREVIEFSNQLSCLVQDANHRLADKIIIVTYDGGEDLSKVIVRAIEHDKLMHRTF